MQLGSYVDRLRHELAVAAEAGGADARALAERLVAPMDSAVRLVLLEALAAAADVITRELAPGSVHVRVRGRDPDFVVVRPAADEPPGAAASGAATGVGDGRDPGEVHDGPVARINFRPPEQLKVRIEEAATREGLSVNAWLVRASAAALERGAHRSETGRSGTGATRYTGWVG